MDWEKKYEERKEFDELKLRVAFLEGLCIDYHNALHELGKANPDKAKLYGKFLERDVIFLHSPHFVHPLTFTPYIP
jgi:hypothetical protein